MKAIQWTVFVDMLGFSELNSNVATDEQARDLIGFMASNVSEMLKYENDVRVTYQSSKQFNLYDWYDVKVAFISDSIVMTFKPKDVVGERDAKKVLMHSANALMLLTMRLVALMQKCLSEKGIIFRGGISTKYCDISERFAVGSGLSAAHEAESRKAVYPRLVLADDVLLNVQLIRKVKWLFKRMYGDYSFLVSEKDVVYINVMSLLLVSSDPRSPNAAWQLNRPIVRDSLIAAGEKLELFLSLQRTLVSDSVGKFYIRYRREFSDPVRRRINRNILKKYFWLRRYHNNTIALTRYKGFSI